jgi:hypothetical protein
MRSRIAAVLAALALAACSEPADPRTNAGTWPPKDYDDFAARPPMSVGRELEDEWTMAIEAERWSYLIGVATIAAGGAPPPEPAAQISPDHLTRTAQGLNEAAARLIVLRNLTCRPPPIAKPADCAAFAPPPWTKTTAPPSKDDLIARLQWFETNAYKFIHPVCAVAVRRTGDQNVCAAE